MSTTTAMPLGLREVNAVSSATLAKLELIGGWDLSFVVERIRNKKLLAESKIEDAIFEFRRMMALCALTEVGFKVPCDEVDEVWHTFLLFSKEYDEFCSKAVGKFVHHVPPESRSRRLKEPKDYLDLYLVYFGNPRSTMPFEFTPQGQKAMCDSGTCSFVD